jgi:four helix bundle protein
MSQSVTREKSFALALSIIRLCQQLQSQREYVISRQLLRSGTSIGANVEEAQAAQSRRYFTAKMSIAAKEARETHYWLRLLHHSQIVNLTLSHELAATDEIIRLLTATVKTSGSSND